MLSMAKWCFSSRKRKRSNSIPNNSKLDATSLRITDMFFKHSWAQYAHLSYLEFIILLMKEMLVDREDGFVRLYLYPLASDFIQGRVFAILIRKKDLYIVGVEDYLGNIYELCPRYPYFNYFKPIGFGVEYSQIFAGGDENLGGNWVVFNVLNDAILKIYHHPSDPSSWVYSCGVFSLKFYEPCRFKWVLHKLNELMVNRSNARILGNYLLMKSLVKKWKVISICACSNQAYHMDYSKPDSELYTFNGAKNLERFPRYAKDALNVRLYNTSGSNIPRVVGCRSGYGTSS